MCSFVDFPNTDYLTWNLSILFCCNSYTSGKHRVIGLSTVLKIAKESCVQSTEEELWPWEVACLNLHRYACESVALSITILCLKMSISFPPVSPSQTIGFGKWRNISKSFEYDQLIQVTSDTDYIIIVFCGYFPKAWKLFCHICWTEAISLIEILNH